MDPNILFKNLYTGPRQVQEPDVLSPIVQSSAPPPPAPRSYPGPGPGPVQCE